MTMIITEDAQQKDRFFKSYVEFGFTKAQESYTTLESYSPFMATLVGMAVTKVQEWTPELIQDLSLEGVDFLDEVLEGALERTKELKETLTREDVVFLIEQLRTEATQARAQVGEKITGYLPSSTIQEYELKEKVQEIIKKVLSQPQIIKDKASDLAKDLHSNLDSDNDGKVSVKDLYENAAGATQVATEFVQTTLSNSILSNLSKDVLSSPSFEEYILPYATPYLDSIKSQWNEGQAIKDAFLPLWSAIEVVKTYVTLYTDNLHSKFEPLSPYLMDLFGSTSVMDLPLEIVQILQAAGGLVSDKERDSVVKETRALFWALIDISFLLEILKKENDETKPAHPMEGVEFVKDARPVENEIGQNSPSMKVEEKVEDDEKKEEVKGKEGELETKGQKH